MVGHLIKEYWADVEAIVVRDYGLSSHAARERIEAYRKRLEARGAADIIYHDGEERTARAVALGGDLEPGTTSNP